MRAPQSSNGENEILNLVDAALGAFKDEFGEIPKNDPNVATLLDLKAKAKNKDYLGIIEMGVVRFKNKPIKLGEGKKRPTLQDKLDEEAIEWAIAEYSSLFDKNKPLQKYQSKKDLSKRIKELKNGLRQGEHAELIDVAAEYLVEYEKATQIIVAQQEHIQFLEKKLLGARSKLKAAVTNRVAGKEKIYKNNNECLKQCYKAFEKSLERPVRGTDYPAYKRFLLKLYKEPPFVPNARLTKEERRRSKITQRDDRSLKQKFSWKDPTVRSAFEKYSGQKATTLKK